MARPYKGKDKKKRKMHPKSLANLAPPVKPGQILNPQGINRKRPWTDRMYEHSEQLLKLSTWGEKKRKALDLPENATWADAAVRELNIKAANGDIQAIKEQADRIEGKAPDRLEITIPPKTEITVRVIHETKPRSGKSNI